MVVVVMFGMLLAGPLALSSIVLFGLSANHHPKIVCVCAIKTR